MHTVIRLTHWALVGYLIVAAGSARAWAARQPQEFKIPAEDLAIALQEFALQSNLQMIYSDAVGSGVTTEKLAGRYTAEEALAHLLRGSKFKTNYLRDGVLRVYRDDARVKAQKIEFAQTAAPVVSTAVPEKSLAGGAPTNNVQEGLQEIVVTATLHDSTVNRVPLSITAETQNSLDEQNIRNVNDLQKLVPGLNVSNALGGVAQFAIRGIATTQGAATTGIYLDDTDLTKRNYLGSANLGVNGAPTPPLFDLERVEVLRGPQGTLYGSSSEGGTVRFITVAPSLTTFSGNARATASALTENGSASGDVGAAIGGPIIQDVLGFRVSAFEQRTGGYIDREDPYNNFEQTDSNINWNNAISVRAALLWAPFEHVTVALANYFSYSHDNSDANTYYLSNSNSYSTPAACFDTTRPFGNKPPPTAAVPCPATALPGQTVGGIFERPGETYGPLSVGRYDTIDPVNNGQTTRLDVTPLTITYDSSWFTTKSITSYITDFGVATGRGNAAEVANIQTTTTFPKSGGFLFYRPDPLYVGTTRSMNERTGLAEELRLTSPSAQERVSWVAGVYLSRNNGEGDFCQDSAATPPSEALFGITTQQRYGVADAPCQAARLQSLRDTEAAAFGEVVYGLTDQLKLIGGLRVSHTEFKFEQAFFGPLVGWNVPSVANSGLTYGDEKGNPVTPKYGLQYDLAPHDMLYATAAKGYRVGGVNNPFSPVCAPGLAALGLTTSDIPGTYSPDSVWSYELGAKLRLWNDRLQINADVYQIDWRNVQLTVAGFAAGCVQTYVANAGTAKSDGTELEAQIQIIDGLQASIALSYTDARYTEAAFGPQPLSGAPASIIVRSGDKFPVPAFTGDLGLQYSFDVNGLRPFVRVDYSYQGSYVRGPGPGVSSYLPDSRDASEVRRMDLRAGVPLGNLQVSLFATNVLNSQDALANGGGRSGCAIATGAACSAFSIYQPYLTVGVTRPREVGAQALYHF